MPDFMQICPVGAELFHTDRQTSGQTRRADRQDERTDKTSGQTRRADRQTSGQTRRADRQDERTDKASGQTRRADRQTKLVVAFRYFANAPKNIRKLCADIYRH
jgi:hypothetical protein